jgi:photosystem II stability/assembly factor-like uncharacterized protein
MKTLIQTLFFFFLITQICFGQWYQQNPLITQNNLFDVILVAENNGWAVGDSGLILKTTNDGMEWIKQQSGVKSKLNAVSFVDANYGWAVGDNGTIISTTNGGLNWLQRNTVFTQNLKEVSFVDQNNGWAVGEEVILYTSDGGSDWINQINIIFNFNGVDFIDANTGWAVGDDGIILKTTNGGLNWWLQTCPVNGRLLDVYIIDENNCWIASSGAILKTTNSGATWGSYGFDADIRGIYFSDLNNGWAVGGGQTILVLGSIIRTTNGGLSWTRQTLSGWRDLHSICFRNSDEGILVGESGTILNSTNGGIDWNSPTRGSTNDWNGVAFRDENNGIVVGSYGKMVITSDGGSEWLNHSSGTTENLQDIQFIDDSIGYAVGDNGKVRKTTNGGITWFSRMWGVTSNLKAVHFTDENNGWVVGGFDPPIVMNTTNGGTSWYKISSPATISLEDVWFINEDIGFIAGGDNIIYGCYGEILRTTDGGNTWSSVFSGSYVWHQLIFLDSLNGFAVGNGGEALGHWGAIFRTTNGGINWISALEDGSVGSFNTIAFSDANHIWVGGGSFSHYPGPGKILFSRDQGENWSTQGEFSNTVYDIFFINSSTGWVVGDNGTILHTTNGGVTFVEEEQINEIPAEFLLSQNYPNPFNPSTKMKYSVTQTSQVQIKVFDVLGNEIETLVKEEKPAGTYELTWYAANLPSGVYFYQLQAGEYTAVKKMILIK